MGNIFVILKPIIHVVMKAAGMTSQLVEIEPGTTMHFWVPTESIHPNNKLTNKSPVLFVQGFIANGIVTWLFQVLSLCSNFAVYVPDLLFFGDSITTRPEWSTSIQAECLAKGMMKLGVEKFSLVGFSYGGMVGFKLAQLYPHMVESMVMTSAVIEMTESISNASLKNVGFTNWPDFLLPKTVSGVKVLLSIGTQKLPWLPEFFYKDFHETMFGNRKKKVELLEALVVSDKDATIKTPNYSQRIYILCGDDDKIFNKTFSDDMKKKLGENATVHYIKDAGHLVHLERPYIYNHYLKKFLTSS
ncbi:putative aminoacrylate hydrolase RutD [Solanum tuberosum]|uniref:putative aminoacrylate hydrolase RutD n=1 Tax=Solanum tuberosum TaxID=4113 RepID=UPI00073A14BF|nr:PREDICTED: putative aminoacrylate hydrolase RutD [Solanum tuberosum]